MRLDRYSDQPFKFQVFRRVDHADGTPAKSGDILARELTGEVVTVAYDDEPVLYERVDPADTLVIKRRDVNAQAALAAYSASARQSGDFELADDVERLRREWSEKTAAAGDAKLPD